MIEWVVVAIVAAGVVTLLVTSARQPPEESGGRRRPTAGGRSKGWRPGKPISPVVGTMLMVGITIVLAAVLYVMVSGLGGR